MNGKVALVTGGGSGIGRAAALAFAHSGARVVLTARGGEVEALIEKTVAEYGRLDYAFTNAASMEEPFAMTADLTEEKFDRSIALNLRSVWLCMKAEIRRMLAQQPAGGAIVNNIVGQWTRRSAAGIALRGVEGRRPRINQIGGARVCARRNPRERPGGCLALLGCGFLRDRPFHDR
jgi:NAD(P)-dependent dehydrogenase (short-subunit alcohol dehydrogenase family)